MVEARKIAELLRQTYDGQPWYGPSLKENLTGVTAEIAFSKSTGGAHTISVIVDHIAFWMEVVMKRLDGKKAEPSPEEDWLTTSVMTKESWEKSIKRLDTAFGDLVERIGKLTLYQLESVVSGKNYDIYTMLHGVIDHIVYHSGQIAILRKNMIQQKQVPGR